MTEGSGRIKPRHIVGFVLTVGFAVVIWLSSSTVVTMEQLANMVSRVLPISPETFLAFWRKCWWLFVKGWHATEFGLLFWLVFALSKRVPRRALTATLVAFGFAFLDEWHQVSVPARGGRLSDVVIDGIGIAVAAYLLTRKPDHKRLPWWGWILGGTVVIALIWVFANFPFGSFG